MSGSVHESARDIPVFDEVDVLVAGGGISGCAAALAAARAGAKTILVERNGCLGGVATASLMASIGNRFLIMSGEQVIQGIAAEVIDRLVAAGAASPRWRRCKAIPLDSERLKVVLIEMLEEAGVTILTHALAARPIVEDKCVGGCFFESKSGRQAIRAKNTVDATGEADLAFQAGAAITEHRGNGSLLFKMTHVHLDQFVKFLGEDPDGFPCAMDRVKDYPSFARDWRRHGGLLFPHGGGKKWRFLREAVDQGKLKAEIPPAINLDVLGMYAWAGGRNVVINSNYYVFERLDVGELSRFETHAQKMCYYVGDFLIDHVPGFENARVEQIGVDLGLRGARWIQGRALLKQEHIRNAPGPTHFDDVIGTTPVEQVPMGEANFKNYTCDIPFGIAVPQGITHLLVGSAKSVSAEGGNSRIVRGMSGCMIIGQATGVAAALGAASDTSASDVPIRDIQRTLLRQDARLGTRERLDELGLEQA